MKIVLDEVVSRTVPKCKVLLVDDDAFIHEMMALYLGKTGFYLISATNAEDAMRMIMSDPPDIVITDAMMPGESGFSLIEKIRAQTSRTNIPIILWTMLEQADGSVMDASGKADILMNKPFYRCDILGNLERAKLMLGRRASANDFTFNVAA